MKKGLLVPAGPVGVENLVCRFGARTVLGTEGFWRKCVMSDSQVDLDRFRRDSSEPLSFRERGATVPFTTPILLNARIRSAEFGLIREMVLVNPSGGRGAFVLPWSSMPEICAPTLYDRHLWESLDEAEDISPIGIRQQAQRLAAQGLAGRHAAAAAREAQLRDQGAQQLMRSMLLERLIASTETAAEKALAAKASGDTSRGERAMQRASAIAEMPLVEFASDLEALSIALSGATRDAQGEESRLQQMLGGLGRLAHGIASWVLEEHDAGPHKMAAQFVYQSARQTMECAEKALTSTHGLIIDFGRLVPHWRAQKEKILAHARTPDWVMDGWRTPLALWETIGPEERRAAIWELALIAPVLPREGKTWLGKTSDWRETPKRVTQTVHEKTDWRSGVLIDLVARNENLLGSAFAFENQVLPLRLSRQQDTAPRIRDRTRAQRAAQAAEGPKDSPTQDDIAAIEGVVQQTDLSRMLEALEGISESLSTTPDQKLLKIVSLVDRLSNTEIHRSLLQASLPRLKLLRPPRPASLKRVLLLPLSGALTNEAQWRRSGAQIPRSAIGPMMEVLCPALGKEAEAIKQQLRGAMLEEPQVVDRFGPKLWQLAAEASGGLQRPSASLSQVGLSERDFQAIIGLAGGLWRCAGPLWDGMQRIGGEWTPDLLRAALIGPANESRQVLAAAFAALMLRAPHPAVFASLIKENPIPNAAVVEEMLNKRLAALCVELAGAEFEAGGRTAAQALLLLEELETVPFSPSNFAAADLVAHRRRIEQFCRSTYREIVSVHVIQGLLNTREDDLEHLTEIEAMARAARSLEDTGQRAAASQGYAVIKDEFRTRMEKALRSSSPPAISAQEIARIGEILLQSTVTKATEESNGRKGPRRQ